MTREEVKAMIQLIQLDRPDFPKVQSQRAMTMLIDLWHDAFGQYDSILMRQAVNNFLKHNQYIPKIASIQAEIDALMCAANPETVESCIKESWQAIQGNKKFEDLSPASQEYWGTQAVIDAAGHDDTTTYAVIAGQMQRRLPSIMARHKTKAETPQAVIDSATKKRLEDVTKLIGG